ncbi:MAG: IclR family transcriptional regulator [Actinomycetota bacterium]|nr:IclR family transcriptional regulator [Actinomycetota bacterium]
MRDRASVHTVVKALRMLAAFQGEGSELGVREFASLLDVHRSTASRLARTLTAHGFLERAAGGGFRLGPEAARIGLLAVGGRSLLSAARAPMDALAGTTGETVVLSVPVGEEALDVAQAGSAHLIGATTWIGRRTPLHASSDGKVFLAFGAAELRASAALEPLTARTVTSISELERQLAQARRDGWTSAVGELEDGLNGVAAPVFARRGDCVGALSVSGPAYRLPPERLPEVAELCIAATRAVAADLNVAEIAA